MRLIEVNTVYRRGAAKFPWHSSGFRYQEAHQGKAKLKDRPPIIVHKCMRHITSDGDTEARELIVVKSGVGKLSQVPRYCE
jgi:hypothetical protein